MPGPSVLVASCLTLFYHVVLPVRQDSQGKINWHLGGHTMPQ